MTTDKITGNLEINPYGKSQQPLMIKGEIENLELIKWLKENNNWVDASLLKYGAILFRGFNIDNAQLFKSTASSLCSSLYDQYGDLPKISEVNSVYLSTPYPANETIHFHNEASHTNLWPQRQFFACIKPSKTGGETPTVDCRKVYLSLPDNIKTKLIKKKIMYVRNFIEGIDVSWKEFFNTESEHEVNQKCIKMNLRNKWKGDNLRIENIVPAIIKHPITDEKIFFNQIQLHHISYLDKNIRDTLVDFLGIDNIPRNVYYGDGSEIENEVLDTINASYKKNANSIPWEKGDLLMLDNMLMAHSRLPYNGERKIIVALGDMVSRN